MKKHSSRYYLYIAALLVALVTGFGQQAFAHKNIVIAGDRMALGSGDGAVTALQNVVGKSAYVSGDGLYVTPESTKLNNTQSFFQRPSAETGAQTIVMGFHNEYAPSIKDSAVYYAYSNDKPIAEWTAEDAAFINSLNPDLLIWMHGASDAEKGTDADSYYTGLKSWMTTLDCKNVVMIQPALSGRLFAARPLEAEYTMPDHSVESAQTRYCAETGLPLVPQYCLDLCIDGARMRASSADLLGAMIAKAAVEPAAATWSTSVTESTPFTVTVSIKDGNGTGAGVSTDLVPALEGFGFEVWRNLGGNTRQLNVTSVTREGTSYTITTNERLVAGDVVVYGCTATGAGRYDGCRGNLAGAFPVPVFALTLGEVKSTDDNITGTITCDGAGVPGVTVSDGYAFATTDANGHYSLSSNKKLGYVFYTLPSGYEPETADNGWQVHIHSLLTSTDTKVAETHDFRLKKVDNGRHIMIVGADAHLAARNQDKSQFKKGFVKSVKDFVAANPDTRIYSTILGDMSWDQYWYANNYALPDFVETMTTQGYPVMLFPVTGNHDNDGAVPAGADCDFKAAIPFRQVMAPSFYSYNLGGVHYVVLDDIVYKNTFTSGKTYSTGIVGDRDYGRYYTDEQMEWLRHDLSLIADKSTPVVVCFHIQNWALSTNGTFTVSANLENGASDRLAEALADFSDVHLLSGHTHYNFHAHPPKYPNIHENNVAGICATWWWTGKLVDRHICKDGSPGGYAIYEADGKDLSWRYRSVDAGDTDDTQFRVYDMNAVKAAYASDADIKTWLAYDKSQTNYATVGDNLVYVNVFNYDTDWTVEVLEGDTPLDVKRITAQDPLHVLCYEVARYKAASTVTADFVTNRTNHMFSAQAKTADAPITVRVTDTFGRTYTRTVNRPGTFDTNLH